MKEKFLNEKTRYLLGLSGQNILYALISSGFAYYLQFTILIPAFWLGIILSFGKIFDAVKDPFIGFYISKSKWSAEKFLKILPVPTAALTVLCFASKIYSFENSGFQNLFIIFYSFLIFIIWETVFSFSDIPMVSYPNLIGKTEEERKVLFSLRNVGAMVCSLSCLIVQPLAFGLSDALGGSAKDEQKAFFLVALFFSAFGGLLFYSTVSKEKLKSPSKKEGSEKALYKYIFTNPLLKKVIISGVLASMNSLPGVILPALVTYYFSGKNSGLTFLYTFLLGTGNFAGMIVSTFLVPVISKKLGNIKAYIICNLGGVFPNLLIFLLFLKNKSGMTDLPNFILMFLLLVLSGVFSAFSSNIRTFLIDDATELEYKISGVKPTALFFSFVTAIIKINGGISSLVSSLGYTLIGFTSSETARLNSYISEGFIPRESSEYTPLFTMLFFMFTVLPAVSSVLAVLPFIKKGCDN